MQNQKQKSDKPTHKATIGQYDCHDHRIIVQDLSSDTENTTVQRKQFITSALQYKMIQRKKWSIQLSVKRSGKQKDSRVKQQEVIWLAEHLTEQPHDG